LINIHIYPSPLLNDSRILREARSIASFSFFKHIELVGMGRSDLLATEELQHDIRIVRLGKLNPQRRFWAKIANMVFWSFIVFVKYRNKQVSCINCHGVKVLPLSVLLKYSIGGAKLVYDAHELETETIGLHGFRKWITKQVERLLIRKADHCVFVGRAIEEWYIQQYGLDNTTVLYNCPTYKDTQQSNYFREKYAVPIEKSIFLYQGGIDEGRGITLLIKAFSHLADRAVLVIMGYGTLKDWVISQTKKYQNIHYHDAVHPDKLLDYTCCTDYGLSVIEDTSMSYKYCMPNKLFEYIMAKKPVLVSPTIEQRNFVIRYGVGEVAIDFSTEAIQQAALKLIDSSPSVYEVGINRVRDEYNWEVQEKKLKDIYSKIIR